MSDPYMDKAAKIAAQVICASNADGAIHAIAAALRAAEDRGRKEEREQIAAHLSAASAAMRASIQNSTYRYDEWTESRIAAYANAAADVRSLKSTPQAQEKGNG